MRDEKKGNIIFFRYGWDWYKVERSGVTPLLKGTEPIKNFSTGTVLCYGDSTNHLNNINYYFLNENVFKNLEDFSDFDETVCQFIEKYFFKAV